MQIELSPAFRAELRELSKNQRRRIARVLDTLRDSFGAPHVHSGLGVRRLRRNYFECRAGLDLRLLFRAERGLLEFVAIGNHDKIRRLIKQLS